LIIPDDFLTEEIFSEAMNINFELYRYIKKTDNRSKIVTQIIKKQKDIGENLSNYLRFIDILNLEDQNEILLHIITNYTLILNSHGMRLILFEIRDQSSKVIFDLFSKILCIDLLVIDIIYKNWYDDFSKLMTREIIELIIEEIKRNTNNYSYESLFRIIDLIRDNNFNNNKFTSEDFQSLYLVLIKINIKNIEYIKNSIVITPTLINYITDYIFKEDPTDINETKKFVDLLREIHRTHPFLREEIFFRAIDANIGNIKYLESAIKYALRPELHSDIYDCIVDKLINNNVLDMQVYKFLPDKWRIKLIEDLAQQNYDKKNIEFICLLRATFENGIGYPTNGVEERVHQISKLLGIDDNIDF